MKRDPTSLEYAILGLVAARVQTGYELCQAFEETPIAAYSSSPGAVYPAIKRLRANGLLQDTPHPASPNSSKKALCISGDGKARLRVWLSSPPSRAEVENDMAGLMLRFAFMSGNVADAVILKFLKMLKAEIEQHVSRLDGYFSTARPLMPLSGALALRSGIDDYRTKLRWCDLSIKAFHEEKEKRGKR